MNEQLKAQRLAWLQEKAGGYTGDGFNPEGRMAAQGSHRRSLATAARCGQCIGDADPNAGRRIADCAIVACALYPHRSHQDGGYRANLAALKATLPSVPRATVLSPMERARLNPESRALAVRAYCYDCMGGQPIGHANTNGDVRKMVRNCSAIKCALWDVRPWQKSADNPADGPADESADDADSESEI